MKIIPVIDLKEGQVVHAREGKRDQYEPIKTQLCESADIFQIIQAFVTIYRFDTIYIADLNAISFKGNHNLLINQVLVSFPELIFWIDQGYQCIGEKLTCPDNYIPVLGSESYRDDNIFELGNYANKFVLSLDFSTTEPLGAESLFSSPELWPDTVIIMTLDRVGSHKGPDLVKLTEFCEQYQNKNFVAAGGIRHQQDLIALSEIGIEHALIASALHAGTLSADEVSKFQAKKYPG
jgi:phosphoribosylformimino-5-aminoimidazole carboxamide ribotide isomerase